MDPYTQAAMILMGCVLLILWAIVRWVRESSVTVASALAEPGESKYEADDILKDLQRILERDAVLWQNVPMVSITIQRYQQLCEQRPGPLGLMTPRQFHERYNLWKAS
jgi:hypothetical protein